MNETNNEVHDSNSNKVLNIKILGSGCPKCMNLEAVTQEAVKELNIKANFEHVKDFSEIAAYGVMRTPALVINEEVVAYGKVLKIDEIKELLHKYN